MLEDGLVRLSRLLSGFGDDAVPGLIEIKNAGGLSIVQDPKEALHASMPCTAIRDDDVDAVSRRKHERHPDPLTAPSA